MYSGETAVKRLILVRHGSIDERFNGRYIGSTDLSLSEQGRQEAQRVGEWLRQFDTARIVASPMQRVRETVEQAFGENHKKKIKYDELLREIDFGDWERLSFSDISEYYQHEISIWNSGYSGFAFPNGERISDFNARVRKFKKKLIRSKTDTFIIFSHGGVILELICDIMDISRDKTLAMRVDRGSVSEVQLFENGVGILTRLNFKPGDMI
jgi:broad specificity phosphatase PhoE